MSLHAVLRRRVSPTFQIDVDIEVPAGITILFGPSGSGKTGILRCIAGLNRPDAGRISLDETVLFDRQAAIDLRPQQRRVGLVFQQLALFPHLTVSANIEYGLRGLPQDERTRRLASIAESFHITDILRRHPGQTSGGERQRTALARALVMEPSALLLDEPLTALDYRIQSRIIDDLRRWNEARRIPMLYVTHAHREVYALGDRMIVMDQGQVVATGTPHEVLDSARTLLVAALAGFENLLSGRVTHRREDAGTMLVHLDDSAVDLEVPLTERAGNGVTVAIRAGDILVAVAPPLGISARNVIEGTIDTLSREGPTIVARVNAGVIVVVHLTPASAEELHLCPGSRVWLIIKTYSCRIATA